MKVQVYKKETLSRTKVVNNILSIWDMTTEEERTDWYQDASDWAVNLSDLSGYSLNKVCGVVAALSPVKRWSDNLIQAHKMIITGDCGHIKIFKDKARAILALPNRCNDEDILNILNGNKIKSFFINILYPQRDTEVTIDRHALSIALGHWITENEYQGITTIQYNFFVECFKLAGKKAKVSGLIMQSATWVRFRKIKSNYR
jgi:hypothetical protein